MSLLREKKLFIFDLDGTLYLGNQVLPGARELIKGLRAIGKSVVFYTNNSAKSVQAYLESLGRLGFDPSLKEIISSADVTADFVLNNRPGKKVFLVGTPSLAEDFEKRGILLSDDADIVISSFDTSLTYQKAEKACLLIRRGAEYFCTHKDTCCPTDRGFVPDSGAIAAMLTAATGVEPRFFGKPDPAGMSLISARTSIPAKDACMFGDRLYTDIAFGNNSGALSILVLTGETSRESAEKCAPAYRPALIYPDLLPVLKDLELS